MFLAVRICWARSPLAKRVSAARIFVSSGANLGQKPFAKMLVKYIKGHNNEEKPKSSESETLRLREMPAPATSCEWKTSARTSVPPLTGLTQLGPGSWRFGRIAKTRRKCLRSLVIQARARQNASQWVLFQGRSGRGPAQTLGRAGGTAGRVVVKPYPSWVCMWHASFWMPGSPFECFC